jgi:ribosomal protein S18 acetylase RimI-like enzyme
MTDSGPGVQIRTFESRDQVQARTLILDGLGEHFSLVDTTLNPDLEDISASYVNQGCVFLVAELDGKVVGTGALTTDSGLQGRIVRVSVARNHRRQGIAEAIVARLIEHARSREYRRILVETNHDWCAAIALYRHCGFEPFARDPESVYLRLELGDTL